MDKLITYFLALLFIISTTHIAQAFRGNYSNPYLQNISRDGTQTIIFGGHKFYFTRNNYIFAHDYTRQTIRDLAKLLNLKGIQCFKFIPAIMPW